MQSQQSADLRYTDGICVVVSWDSADLPPNVPGICGSALLCRVILRICLPVSRESADLRCSVVGFCRSASDSCSALRGRFADSRDTVAQIRRFLGLCVTDFCDTVWQIRRVPGYYNADLQVPVTLLPRSAVCCDCMTQIGLST